MKNYLLSLISVLMGGLSLSSCSEDNRIAMRLEGEWYGDFGMYYSYRFLDGCDVCYDSYDTRMKFSNEFFSSSWLYVYQVDWYDERPYNVYGEVDYRNGHVSPFEYVYHRAECHVKDRELRFRYKGEREWDTNIRDYSLSNNYFDGYFDNGARFSLRSSRWDYWDRYCIEGHYYDTWTRAGGKPAELQITPRKDKFLVCPKEDGTVLIDREENPTMIVKLRQGVDPNSIDMSNLRFGNRYQDMTK